MDEKILFTVKTTMEKEDLRKFLYLATFKKTPIIIPMILFMAAIGATVITFDNGPFNMVAFLIVWVIMTVIAFGITFIDILFTNKNNVHS